MTAEHRAAERNLPRLPLLELYGDPEIGSQFSREAHIAAWLEVERALAVAQEELGVTPPAAAAAIAAAADARRIDPELLDERTRVVGYPILPLLEQVAADAPPTVEDHLHWGATTQDVMDTGDALRHARATTLVAVRLDAVGDEVARLARLHRSTILAGRTHMQQAVPTTFGAKLAVWLQELGRHRERLAAARARVATVELFGAAGTAAALGPDSAAVRQRVAELLGLAHRAVPGHTARDSVAELGFALAATCATCSKIAREVAELARTEIGELAESGGHLRGASSTMPQKRNPIDSEAVIGLGLLAIQQLPVLLHAMQPAHERATGEWHAEWDAVPLLFAFAGGSLRTLREVLSGLVVDPARMRANLDLDGGRIMSEAVMMAAAPLVGRARAHGLVYDASVASRERGIPLAEALREQLDPELTLRLSLDETLDPARYLGEATAIVDAAVEAWETAGSPATGVEASG